MAKAVVSTTQRLEIATRDVSVTFSAVCTSMGVGAAPGWVAIEDLDDDCGARRRSLVLVLAKLPIRSR